MTPRPSAPEVTRPAGPRHQALKPPLSRRADPALLAERAGMAGLRGGSALRLLGAAYPIQNFGKSAGANLPHEVWRRRRAAQVRPPRMPSKSR